MKISRLIMALCSTLTMVCCQTADDQDVAPQLTFDGDQTIIYQLLDEKTEIVPTFDGISTDDVTLSWYVNSKYVGDAKTYTHWGQRLSEANICVIATSDNFAAAKRDYKVITRRQMSFDLENMETDSQYAPGSTVTLIPKINNLPAGVKYSWIEAEEEISTADRIVLKSDVEVEHNLMLVASAEGMSSISVEYSVKFASVYSHPEIYIKGFNSLAKSSDAIIIDDVSYYFSLANIPNWTVSESTYLSRYNINGTAKSIKVIAKEKSYWNWKTDVAGIWGNEKGGTIMCNLFNSKYNSTLGAWPEYINDGEERYFNASIAMRPNPNADAPAIMIAETGPALLFTASQTKVKDESDASLPMIELGWNADGKFGVWARSGVTGAEDDAKLEAKFLEVESPFVANEWTDLVVAYKYSPKSADGWIKLYVKSSTEEYADFKEYKLENIQVGYSKAPTSIDNVEFGYTGIAHEGGFEIFYNCISYTDHWVDDYFPTVVVE